MTKKHDTIYDSEQDDNVFDNEFIEQEFINELTEWRTNEQSSDYCSGD